MKVKLQSAARVLLEKGIYDLSEKEARRLLALGIAEPVNDPVPEEKPKKTRKKKKAE